uniref:Glycosyltransferase n=1 Tax=viral metagenome TaxID=1070528 RepID=A0A6C0H6L8_9ZZZZ
MGVYGFIITRHVNSDLTNKYWNQCVKLIRTYYPYRHIIIIDDNSNYSFVKPEFPYKNLTIIQSEYPGRGELLPFIYFLRYHWWDNAVIIHDSVFIHKHIPFENFKLSVLPMWHFTKDREHYSTVLKNINGLKNNSEIFKIINDNETFMTLNKTNAKWFGVFGVQCFINYNFLKKIQDKYDINNLLNYITCREDRCSLERIMGILFFLESPAHRFSVRKSILGDIRSYLPWGYTFNDYNTSFKQGKILKNVVKVWTGR